MTELIKAIKTLEASEGVNLPSNLTVGALRRILSALPNDAKVMLMNENEAVLLNAPHDVFVYNLEQSADPDFADIKDYTRPKFRSVAGAANTVVFGFWNVGRMKLELEDEEDEELSDLVK